MSYFYPYTLYVGHQVDTSKWLFRVQFKSHSGELIGLSIGKDGYNLAKIAEASGEDVYMWPSKLPGTSITYITIKFDIGHNPGELDKKVEKIVSLLERNSEKWAKIIDRKGHTWKHEHPHPHQHPHPHEQRSRAVTLGQYI